MSPAAPIGPDVARVDDPAIHTGELDTLARFGIEVDSGYCSARDRSADVPISTRRHRAQRLDRFHSANVGNSNCRASLLSPMARPLLAPALILCGAASLPVRVAVLGRPLIVSAGETIVIAAIVFGRTGDSSRGGERQDQGCRSNGDQAPQGLLPLVFSGDGRRLLVKCINLKVIKTRQTKSLGELVAPQAGRSVSLFHPTRQCRLGVAMSARTSMRRARWGSCALLPQISCRRKGARARSSLLGSSAACTTAVGANRALIWMRRLAQASAFVPWPRRPALRAPRSATTSR